MKKLRLEELGRQSVEEFKSSAKVPIVVVLDNIRSALNVGSIFRTCDGFAIERLVLTGITAQPPHREISKTAIGATRSVNWAYEASVTTAIQALKLEGYHIIGIEQTDKSQSLFQWSPEANSRIAIVLGNEVDGISKEALETLDEALEIAQFGTKHSLNVSVCAGIVLWHMGALLRRQS